MKKFRSIFVLPFMLSVLLLYACTPNVNVRREAGMLDLNYSFPETKATKTNLVIAVVSPTLADKDFSKANTYQYSPETDFNFRFYRDYSEQMRNGFANALQEVFSRKGFNLKGPFSSFDDLTFKDKKDAYLAVVPVMNVNLEKIAVKQTSDMFTNVRTEDGFIQVGGELRLDFIEPMTKEKILVQRINLSSFRIQKPYRVQRPPMGGFGSFLAAQSDLVDTADKAMADASNEFFKKSIEKIWEFVSTEELLRYKEQIQSLKGLKRF